MNTLNIESIPALNKSFDELLDTNISTGNVDQIKNINTLMYRIKYNSLKIQKEIQSRVHEIYINPDERYNTNGCDMITLILNSDQIRFCIQEVRRLSKIYSNLMKIVRAPMIIASSNTKREFGPISKTISESTIYRTFITYCRMGTTFLVPAQLNSFCSRIPEHFNRFDTLSVQIQFLKTNDHIYDIKQFNELINTVGKMGINEMATKIHSVTRIEMFSNAFSKSSTENINKFQELINFDFLKQIMGVKNMEGMEKITSSREFKNYNNKLLDFINDGKTKMKELILLYSTKNKKTNSIKFINSFSTWEISKSPESSADFLLKYSNFCKNAVNLMMTTIPSIIQNNIDYGPTSGHGKNKLVENHLNMLKKFFEMYNTQIKQNYDDDDATNKILNDVLDNIQILEPQLYEIINTLPPFFNFLDKSDNFYLYLYEAFVIHVFNVYIMLSEKSDTLNMPDNLTIYNDQHANITAKKSVVADLIVSYTNILSDIKSVVDMPYKTIMDDVFKIKEKERAEIILRMSRLSPEDRANETYNKKNKLGIWGSARESSQRGNFVFENIDKDNGDDGYEDGGDGYEDGGDGDEYGDDGNSDE